MGAIGKWVVVALALAALVIMAYGATKAHTPEGRAKADARERIAQCVKARDDALSDLATRRFMREACQQMENDYRAKWGVPSHAL
jgi:lysylphosphatidylglycerol synthetase-like protein (DUF2156 family)